MVVGNSMITLVFFVMLFIGPYMTLVLLRKALLSGNYTYHKLARIVAYGFELPLLLGSFFSFYMEDPLFFLNKTTLILIIGINLFQFFGLYFLMWLALKIGIFKKMEEKIRKGSKRKMP